jgi:hypothetical protein
MQWLPTALVSSASILKIVDVFTNKERGNALSYRRLGTIALVFAMTIDQVNTIYTLGSVSLPPLKCVEGIALLSGTVLLMLDSNQEREQLPRFILSALTIFRLIGEMRGNNILSGSQALPLLGSLWHSLVSLEIGACLLLLDRRFQ